jgi:hypothetical protein
MGNNNPVIWADLERTVYADGCLWNAFCDVRVLFSTVKAGKICAGHEANFVYVVLLCGCRIKVQITNFPGNGSRFRPFENSIRESSIDIGGFVFPCRVSGYWMRDTTWWERVGTMVMESKRFNHATAKANKLTRPWANSIQLTTSQLVNNVLESPSGCSRFQIQICPWTQWYSHLFFPLIFISHTCKCQCSTLN